MEDGEERAAQREELLVLESIYGPELKKHSEWSFEIAISPNVSCLQDKEGESVPPLSFQFSYPEDYPSRSAPSFGLRASWCPEGLAQQESAEEKGLTLEQALLRMFHEQQDVVVFQWIEWLRENVASHLGWSEEQWRQRLPSSPSTSSPSSAGTDATITRCAIPILHGQPVTDRKSKFQAHLARVQTTEEVQQVMSQLLSDKKIAIATHNISAYRIRTSSGTIHANRDDDGEKGAGDKLLYLLEMMDACNIVVVVSRWFGGTMLGPDRFKHITNVAKEIIEEARLESSGHGRSNDGEGGSKEERGKQCPLKMYNRIKWDAAIDADDVVVGLLPKDSSGDKAEQPQLEVPFTQLEEQDTNLNEATSAFWKRVQYFKTVSTGEMLWQRQPRR